MLPSVPEIVRAVAFVAAAVRVEELPDVIDVGFAVMPAVGAAVVPACTVIFRDV